MTEQKSISNQEQASKRSFVSKPKQKQDNVEVEDNSGGHSRTLVWVLLALMATFFLFLTAVGFLAYRYTDQVTESSGLTVDEIVEKVQTGWQLKLFQDRERINILLYGLDAINGEREASKLTDTILLVSISESGRVDLISIPRDLWIASLQTKINALYYYGEESEETTGVGLLSTVVEEVTGQKIDYHLELSLEDVVKLVDAMGGVEIEVGEGFVDEKYPRKGVDISSNDPEVLYERVEFDPGLQTMNGERVEKYIRSRNSQNELQGNDVARSVRQQLVIMALVKKLQQPGLWLDPMIAGSIYKHWHVIETDLNDETILALAKKLVGQNFQIHTHTITSAEHLENEVLIVPPIEKYDAWVYEPVDPSWEELQAWIADHLKK